MAHIYLEHLISPYLCEILYNLKESIYFLLLLRIKFLTILSSFFKFLLRLFSFRKNSEMQITINGIPHESKSDISLQTFNGTDIENQQFKMMIKADENSALMLQDQYGVDKFRGEPTRMYNCHGLTFACRRTGIYDNEMVKTILKEEYIEIKKREDVISGDIAIYVRGGEIIHSGMVVHKDNIFIRILSKECRYKEIEHLVDMTPHKTGSEIKYYRIKHEYTKIIS